MFNLGSDLTAILQLFLGVVELTEDDLEEGGRVVGDLLLAEDVHLQLQAGG